MAHAIRAESDERDALPVPATASAMAMAAPSPQPRLSLQPRRSSSSFSESEDSYAPHNQVVARSAQGAVFYLFNHQVQHGLSIALPVVALWLPCWLILCII